VKKGSVSYETMVDIISNIIKKYIDIKSYQLKSKKKMIKDRIGGYQRVKMESTGNIKDVFDHTEIEVPKHVMNSMDYEIIDMGNGIKIKPAELYEIAEVLIPVNPVYDWLSNNINNISYKLLKGFITNFVPLGYTGKKYFAEVAHKKVGFAAELLKLYDHLEKMNCEGVLRRVSYLELYELGYTGELIGEKYPFDDILKRAT
jgi:hypothetical protein